MGRARPGQETLGEAVGRRVSRLRRCVRPVLSQEELARQAGVSRSYIAKIEGGKGDPTIGIAARIAEALKVPLSELVKGNHSDPCLEEWHRLGVEACRVFHRMGMTPEDAPPCVWCIASLAEQCCLARRRKQ